jgi:hypothetical protein
MKQILFLLLAVLLLTACSKMPKTPAPLGADAPADKVPNIVGDYALNATDASGEDYGGTLTISAGDKPDEYNLQWIISGGIHTGTGKLEGNKLTVTWKSVEAGTGINHSGSASYTVTVNGELYGTRSIDGIDKPGTETAYPNPK